MSFMRTTKWQRRGIVKARRTPAEMTTTAWKKARKARVAALGRKPNPSPKPFVASATDRALINAAFGR